MAKLTIKGEGKGAEKVLSGLEKLISKAEASTIRLANISKSLAGHYSAAKIQADTLNKTLTSSARWSLQIAGQAKKLKTNYNAVTGEIQRSNREMAKLVTNTERAAKASQKIKGIGVVSGGQRRGPISRDVPLTPATLKGIAARRARASSQKIVGEGLAKLQQDAPGLISRTVTAAFNTAGKIGKKFVGQFKTAFGGALVSAGKAGFAAILTVGIGVMKGIGNILLGVLRATFTVIFRLAEAGLKVAFTAAAAFLGNAIRLAIKDQPIAEGFGKLVEGRGLGEQTKVLGELREAARGTVSDLQLMSSANNALLLGAADTTEQLNFMIEAGRRLGKVTGRTATEGFNDLSIGIGRQSRLILDNLGLIVKVDDAYKRYAKRLGTTADKLGESERRFAFQQAAFESIRSKMAELGKEQLTVTDRIGQLSASFSNLSVKVGQGFLPEIEKLTIKWGEFVDNVDPEDIKAAFSDTFEFIQSGFSKTLDFLFKGELREGFTTFSDDFFNAINNPSEQAFKIVGIRFKQMFDLGVNRFEELWDKFVSFANEAGGKVLFGPIGTIFKKIAGEQFTPKQTRKTIGSLAESNRAAIGRTADLEAQALKDELAGLASIEKERLSYEKTKDRIGSVAGGGPKIAGAGPQTRLAAAAAAEADVRREATKVAQQEKKERKEATAALKAHKKELRESEKRLRANSRAMDREISDRERVADELRAAAGNLTAALEGREQEQDLPAILNDTAEELRGFVDVLHGLNIDVAQAQRDIDDAFGAMVDQIGKVSEDFSRDLRARAKSFLLGGEVPGETTRVKSLRRKAQREQRRKNREVFQREVGSQGFGDQIGGGLGGFGQQDVGRAGGLLEKGVPGLESALAQIINADGETLIAQLQSEIATVVTEGNAEQQELIARKEEALELQREAQQQQKELFERSLDVEKEVIKLLQEETKDINDLKAKLKSIERELESVRREARK